MMVKNSLFKKSIHQFILLLWKNFTIQKRSIFGSLLILILPALFAVILMPIRILVKSKSHPNDTTFKPIRFDNFDPELPLFGNSSFAYHPNNSEVVNKIMSKVSDSLSLDYQSFRTENEMVQYLSKDFTYKVFGVSVLNDSVKNFTYKLRFSYSPRNEDRKTDWQDWKTNLMWPIFPVLGPRSKHDNNGGEPGYYMEGFLTVQKLIDYSLISEFNSDVKNIDIQLKRFSYSSYEEDNFVIILIAIFPYVMELSFAFTAILTARAIAHEKETGLKEAMKLMGMKSWIYWLSWYIKTFIMLLPALLFMIFCYTYKLPNSSGGKLAIIDKTDGSIFALLIFSYASSLITFTLMCSTFFKKSSSAAAGTGIIYFSSFLPYIYISLRYEQMTIFWKIASCFVNSLAMCLGVQLIGMFEGMGIGVKFSNWTEGINHEDHFAIIHVLLILFLSNFIYMFFTYYFDNIFPGDHGIAKPWDFLFAEFFSKRTRHKVKCAEKENEIITLIENEAIYDSRKIGIKLSNVHKIYEQFGNAKTAVNNLTLNIYEGQISVLLGHNGAGKSTTISMITGVCEPTSGNIQINSNDIIQETEKARSVLGYCPQHNLLFDDLTVYEHLKFFSLLKQNYNENEITEMLSLINLSEKKHQLARTLSGGMKRKLSVAIAFIGGSKTVILDEPSSGMDPQARHSTWSLLKRFKNEKKCTILMTTHFMDEADYLGDRIAIMSKGDLRCCGSPLFLKSNYGSGYTLVLTRNQNDLNEVAANKIISLVQNVLPNFKLNSNINSEMSFLLSVEDSSKFPLLFDQLDQFKEELGIINVGISATTVEQVFLKIEDDYQLDSEELTPKMTNTDSIDLGLWTGSEPKHLITNKFVFLFNQFKGLIKKRLIYSARTKSLVLSQIIFPIMILLINLIFIKYGPLKYGDSRELKIDISKYSTNYLPYNVHSDDLNSTSKNNQYLNTLSDFFKNQFNNSNLVKAFNLNEIDDVQFCAASRKDIKEYLNCLGKISHKKLNNEHITAVEFIYNNFTRTVQDKNLKIIGHFNNQAYHVPPLSLNLITNALYKYYTNSSNYSINVINHPLPQNITDTVKEILTKDTVSFTMASSITLGLSFIMASFATFLISEKVSGAKHLQFLNGCSSYMYWLSTFLYDILNYWIPVLFMVAIIMLFHLDGLISGSRWMNVLTLFAVYGFAHIPQIYLLSNRFQSPSSGYSNILTWNIFSSQMTLVIIRILSIPNMKTIELANFLQTLFSIFLPNYAMGQSLIDIYDNYQTVKVCKSAQKLCRIYPNPCCRYFDTNLGKPCGSDYDCLYWNESSWTWQKPGLLKFITFMLLQSVIQFLILFLYESGHLRKLRYFMAKIKFMSEKNESKILKNQLIMEKLYGDVEKDSDVLEEEERIAQNSTFDDHNSEIFLANKLTKSYSNFKAVKGISFAIKNSECFGLLGVNGAGKTSTFKMITGDELITAGDVFLNQFSIKKNIHQFQKNLGYCPQLDPLIDQMTVMETLEMYFNLRGVRNELISKACFSLLELLDLIEHKDKMCSTLSGGNKRKLSVAIALVGSPSVILLDEPTSGMDPKARRTLWNCLNSIRNKGKSLILTTHNMDEAEALCTKIAIMVNGELKCIGSLQHLKGRYGEGYQLVAKIESSNKKISIKANVKEFISFVLNSFENSELKESREGFLSFHIKDSSKRQLSNIFTLIEKNKFKYSIEYYLVTETILEQIFLNFASKQIDPENRITKDMDLSFNKSKLNDSDCSLRRTPNKDSGALEILMNNSDSSSKSENDDIEKKKI